MIVLKEIFSYDTISIGNEFDNFGYPYCYTSSNGLHIATTNEDIDAYLKYPSNVSGSHDCQEYKQSFPLEQNIAPLGLTFLNTSCILIAERGAFGKGTEHGYKISAVDFKNRQFSNYRSYMTGFASNTSVYGRPVDIARHNNQIFISDDFANVVYRLTVK